jgi:hypothetical protein
MPYRSAYLLPLRCPTFLVLSEMHRGSSKQVAEQDEVGKNGTKGRMAKANREETVVQKVGDSEDTL